MSLIKCKKCGEMFSDSYKTCPFCAEDEEYYNGKVKKRGHRQVEKKKKTPSVIGPVLVLVLVLLAAILIWFFAGDTIKGWFDGKEPDSTQDSQQQQTVTPPDNETGDLPEATELKLDHLTLIMAPGASEKLTATGGSGESYQWITSDSGVLKVDDNGTVTAIAEGSAVVTVTCGEESAACAITVKENADSSTAPDTDTDTDTDTSTGTNTGTNTGTGTGTTLKDATVKTIYGSLSKNPNGQFDLTVGSGESIDLTVEGVSGTVTWSSKDSSIATVSSSGTVKGVSGGKSTVITAKVGSGTVEILVRVN